MEYEGNFILLVFIIRAFDYMSYPFKLTFNIAGTYYRNVFIKIDFKKLIYQSFSAIYPYHGVRIIRV